MSLTLQIEQLTIFIVHRCLLLCTVWRLNAPMWNWTHFKWNHTRPHVTWSCFAPSLPWCLCKCLSYFPETQQQQGGESMSLSPMLRKVHLFIYFNEWQIICRLVFDARGVTLNLKQSAVVTVYLLIFFFFKWSRLLIEDLIWRNAVTLSLI